MEDDCVTLMQEIETLWKEIKEYRERNDLVSPGNMGHDARMANFFALIGQAMAKDEC